MHSASSLFSSSDSSDDEERRLYVVAPRRNFDGPHIGFAEARFRLSSQQLQYLCELLGPSLAASDSQQRRKGFVLTVKEQVAIGLRVLATGSTYRTVGDAHGVAIGTVSAIVKRFVEVVVDVMCPVYIRIPTGEDLQRSVDGFRQLNGMMDVWAVVDGTHVKVHPPSELEAAFVNRHHEHSLNCQVVCLHSLEICSLSSRWGGSVHDSRVFRNSSLGRRLESGWRPDGLNLVLLGDSAYRSSAYLRTPHSRAGGRVLTVDQQEFNDRHRRARTVVERCIGVLKSQFRSLKDLRIRGPRQTGENSMELTANAVRACVALRNFLIVHKAEQVEDVDSDLGDSSPSSG